MTEVRDKLQQLTECSICFQAFNDPRTLICFHTFCLECLKKTAEASEKVPGENMPCPLCGKDFPVPADGISGLQKSFFMQHLMDVTTMLQTTVTGRKKEIIDCDVCKTLQKKVEQKSTEKSNEAIMHCLECKENLCDVCLKAHEFNNTHNIVKIGTETEEYVRILQPTSNCSVHNNQPLNFYCADCKKIICVSCFVENHGSHKCKDVTTVKKEFCQTIENDTMKIRNCLEQILSKGRMIEETKMEVLLSLAKVEGKILKRNVELKEMVDKHTQSLLNELSLIKQKQIKDFANEKEDIDRSQTILKSFETYCTELRLKGSASDVCSCVDELIARASELERDHRTFMDRPLLITKVTFERTELIAEPTTLLNNNIVGQIQCKLWKQSCGLVSKRKLTSETSDIILHQFEERTLIPEGLQNYGNTCYFNSVLQCLLQTVLLPFELTANLNELTAKVKMHSLSKEFVKLTSNYSRSELRSSALKTLYCKFTAASQNFNDQKQRDCHDLLLRFLDKLRVEERNARGIPSAGPETLKLLTAVDRIFGGEFIVVYTCHSCEELHAVREPFLDISIPFSALIQADRKPKEKKSKHTRLDEFQTMHVGAASKMYTGRDTRKANVCCSSSVTGNEAIKNMLQPITLEATADSERKYFPFKTKPNVSQCLKYITRAEVIKDEYLFGNCQTLGSHEIKMTSATRCILISSPPAILVLHLKRFDQSPAGVVKRETMIPYNELLDLGPFCSFGAQRIDPKEENVWYSLYAVVVHHGPLLSQGHYVSYVKQRDCSAQLDSNLREKFLQRNFGERYSVPDDNDLAAMEKRTAVKKREKAKRPRPIPGQWFYVSDDSVRRCDAKTALEQKAYLLFYERIQGTEKTIDYA